jgi:hypothetical protein
MSVSVCVSVRDLNLQFKFTPRYAIFEDDLARYADAVLISPKIEWPIGGAVGQVGGLPGQSGQGRWVMDHFVRFVMVSNVPCPPQELAR